MAVDQQIIPVPGGIAFGPPKSKHSERTTALDPVTVNALRAHRDVRQLERDTATLALTATPPVPLHIVAGRLGDDPTTLLSTYAHLLPQSDEQTAESLASVLDDKPLTNSAA